MTFPLELLLPPYDEIDFTRMSFDSRVSFSRSTTAARYKADKSIEFSANDVPRIDHDPLTGAVLGLLLEEQRTNLLPRSVTDDGTAGVLGSGGALPTGWGVQAALGLTVEILATNIDPVLGGCRIRVYGTTTSSGTFRAQCTSGYSSTVGQTYVTSQFARRVAGNDAPNLGISSVNFNSLSPATNGRIGASASLAAARVFGMASVSGSASLRNELRFSAANATAYDFTVEITGGQIENNSEPSSYIPTPSTSAVTRARDYGSITVPPNVVRLVTIFWDGTSNSEVVTPGATYNIPVGQKPILRMRGYYTP